MISFKTKTLQKQAFKGKLPETLVFSGYLDISFKMKILQRRIFKDTKTHFQEEIGRSTGMFSIY